MKLTYMQIEKFQEIYEKEYGKKLTKTEALRMGIELINLIKTLLEFKVKK